MKKFICLLISALMLISLCGCFDATDVRGDINSKTDSDQTEENSFSMGETAENSYKNDFLGISCQLPAEWKFYSEKEILALNNIAVDNLDEEAQKQLENATIIYDMYATNEADFSNLNVNLEKLNALQLASLDIKATLEAQFDTIRSSYENMGYTDVNIAYQKIKVDGKEFDGMKIEAKIQGVAFYTTAFAFKKGNYLANVTAGSLQTDKIGEIFGYFTIS